MDHFPFTLPPTALVMVGSIVAAFITGLFSWVNLVGTKEQSVSKLQSEWIEAIIDALATLLSEIELILRLVEHELKAPGEGLDKQELLEFRRRNVQEYQRMNTAFNAVRLRLDKREPEHQLILNDLTLLHDSFYGHCGNLPDIMLINDQLIQHTQMLSRDVWIRIREGGRQYQKLRRIVSVVILSSLSAAIVIGGVECGRGLIDHPTAAAAPTAGTTAVTTRPAGQSDGRPAGLGHGVNG